MFHFSRKKMDHHARKKWQLTKNNEEARKNEKNERGQHDFATALSHNDEHKPSHKSKSI